MLVNKIHDTNTFYVNIETFVRISWNDFSFSSLELIKHIQNNIVSYDIIDDFRKKIWSQFLIEARIMDKVEYQLKEQHKNDHMLIIDMIADMVERSDRPQDLTSFFQKGFDKLCSTHINHYDNVFRDYLKSKYGQ